MGLEGQSLITYEDEEGVHRQFLGSEGDSSGFLLAQILNEKMGQYLK